MRLSLTDLWSSTRPSERSLHCGQDQDTRTCTIEKNIHTTLKYPNLLKKHLDHAEPRCQHFWIQQRGSRILTYFQVVRLILVHETMPNLNLPNFASCVLPQTIYPFEGSSVKKILPSQRWPHQKQCWTCGSTNNGQQIRFGVYCKSHKIKTGDKVDMSTEKCQKDLEWSRTWVFRAKMRMLTTQKSGFFPTCQVRVVRFYVSSTPSFILPSSAGPQLQARDRSGPRQTRTESPGSEWSPPDPNSKPR